MRLRGAIFNECRTYGNYVNFIRKACFYLNIPTDWFPDASISASKSIRSAGKGKFRCPNFIRSDISIKVISAEHHSIRFDQLAFCAYLFDVRVPSEALVLRRAYPNGPLDMIPPLNWRKG